MPSTGPVTGERPAVAAWSPGGDQRSSHSSAWRRSPARARDQPGGEEPNGDRRSPRRDSTCGSMSGSRWRPLRACRRHSTANRPKPVGTATTLTWPRTSFAKLEPSPAMPPARTTRPWRIGQV